MAQAPAMAAEPDLKGPGSSVPRAVSLVGSAVPNALERAG